MDQETVTLRLPRIMLTAARALARERDVTVGQVLRDLLGREISKASTRTDPVRADEQLVAPLRACLASDLAKAVDWHDLDTRLKDKGFVLRIAGGGLALHDWPRNRRLCKASELGFSYSRLMRRFDAPFPEHPHEWLIDRMLQDDPAGKRHA